MAQGRLTVAGVAVLLGGAATELAVAPTPAGLLDWAVGVAFVLAALRTHAGLADLPQARARPAQWLGPATAACWYLATLIPAVAPGRGGWWQLAATVAVLSFRGPLLHWLVVHAVVAPRRGPTVLVAAGYLVTLTGRRASAVATAGVAVALALMVLRAVRRQGYPADLRRSAERSAGVLVLLAAGWGVSASGALPATASLLLADGSLLLTAWSLSRPAGSAGLTGAVDSLILQLGAATGPASPVSATLARALADPELKIRTFQPDVGWTDELGRPADDPRDGTARDHLTEVTAPGGGLVVLVHGSSDSADTELARAAAAAAALALESVRVEALVQREAADVRRSAARLVLVDDDERQALARRLRAGPIDRLERVRASLRRAGGTPADAVSDELDRVLAELVGLAGGLHPIALREQPLRRALAELVDGAAVPTSLAVSGEVDDLPGDTAALVYFVVAECLTNTARHARATSASVALRVGDAVTLEVRDDGRGGAAPAPGRGLAGLADRVTIAGGVLTLDSPVGGPTRVQVSVPSVQAPSRGARGA